LKKMGRGREGRGREGGGREGGGREGIVRREERRSKPGWFGSRGSQKQQWLPQMRLRPRRRERCWHEQRARRHRAARNSSGADGSASATHARGVWGVSCPKRDGTASNANVGRLKTPRATRSPIRPGRGVRETASRRRTAKRRTSMELERVLGSHDDRQPLTEIAATRWCTRRRG
jgi:hypothetical protein